MEASRRGPTKQGLDFGPLMEDEEEYKAEKLGDGGGGLNRAPGKLQSLDRKAIRDSEAR